MNGNKNHKMKVKIEKCDMSLNWYYNHIGETFDVVETDDIDYLVLKDNNDIALVKIEDCEIIQ